MVHIVFNSSYFIEITNEFNQIILSPKEKVTESVFLEYVLCDSRFTCQVLITAVRSKHIHPTRMYKIGKAEFLYRGRQMNYRQINSSIDEITRCRKMRLHCKRAEVMSKGIAATLFFTRQGREGKWKVFLTADTKSSFVKLMEIYRIRWSMEVFFKEAKQL